eukprot:m.520530 g.520530  ORF g.520530 m.520530 type:complete len:1055 (-) comp21952_c0_seq1:400-3564(-)
MVLQNMLSKTISVDVRRAPCSPDVLVKEIHGPDCGYTKHISHTTGVQISLQWPPGGPPLQGSAEHNYLNVILQHAHQSNLEDAAALVKDLVNTVMGSHPIQPPCSGNAPIGDQPGTRATFSHVPSHMCTPVAFGHVHQPPQQQVSADPNRNTVVCTTMWNGTAPPRPPPTAHQQLPQHIVYQPPIAPPSTHKVYPIPPHSHVHVGLTQQSTQLYPPYVPHAAHSTHPRFYPQPPPNPQSYHHATNVTLPQGLAQNHTVSMNDRQAPTQTASPNAVRHQSATPAAVPQSGQLHVPDEYEKIQRGEFIGPALPWCIPKIEYDKEHTDRLLGRVADTPELTSLRAAAAEVRRDKAARANPIAFARASSPPPPGSESSSASRDGAAPKNPSAPATTTPAEGGRKGDGTRASVPRAAPLQGWSTTELRDESDEPASAKEPGVSLESALAREAELEVTLHGYEQQLEEVTSMLPAAVADELGGTDPALAELVTDLRQLIALTSEELLTCKRQRLVGSLEEGSAATITATPTHTSISDAAGGKNPSESIHPGALDAAAMHELWSTVNARNDTSDTPRPHTPTSDAVDGSSTATVPTARHGTQVSSTKARLDFSVFDAYVRGAGHRLVEGEEVTPETRCRAPFCHEWGGGWTYHNAVVYTVDPDARTCSVLFTSPRHIAMVTCPWFLKDACRRGSSCRYSHGFKVATERLRPYQEPDFPSLRLGSVLLVRYRDGAWYPAVLLEVLDAAGVAVQLPGAVEQCRVRFVEYDSEGVVPLRDVMPMERSCASDDDTSDDEAAAPRADAVLDGPSVIRADDARVDTAADSDGADEFVPYRLGAQNPSEGNSAAADGTRELSLAAAGLGMWEAHTSGFGSKLLTKMGYVAGTGLGIRGNGRVEPVPVQVLPPGCGLDHIMQLRREGRLDTARRHGNRAPKRKNASQAKSDVFGYLNAAFASAGAPPLGSESEPLHVSTPAVAHAKKKTNKDERLALNVKALEIQSTIDRLTSAIAEFKARVKRNPGLAEQLSDQITWHESELRTMEKKLAHITSRQKQSSNRKKLRVF